MVDSSEIQSRQTYDPDKEHLAGVYAKGLLRAVENSGQAEQVVAELESYVVDVLQKIPQLNDALCSPRISIAEKKNLIDKSAAGANTDLIRFLKVVCDHGRANCLAVIAAAARRMHNEASGLVEAIAITAVPASQSMQASIEQGIGSMLGKQVSVKYQVDPSVMGGLVVRIGDRVYDGSLANQLQSARQRIGSQALQELRQSRERFVKES
jgi:F-type H+-transporting ATPase subunit delta